MLRGVPVALKLLETAEIRRMWLRVLRMRGGDIDFKFLQAFPN